MRPLLRHSLFALFSFAAVDHLCAQAITYLYTGGNDSYWGNGLNWYAYNPATGLQTNGSVPPLDGTITVAAVTATFVSGTQEVPNRYAYSGPFEAINSRLTTTLGGWDTHNATLALRGTSVVRGLTVGGGLEVRNEGALTIDYDGSGNGNLGSYDMFRMRNAAGATVDIVTTENSARIISMGYYSGYFANEGVTRINTLSGSSVHFKNSYYGGVLSNSGSLEKSGIGNLVADYYSQASTGGTFVEAGEFRAWGADLDGVIDVSSGATFRISGNAIFRDGLEGRGAGAYLADAGTIKPEGDTTFNRLTLAGAKILNEASVATLTIGDLVISSGNVGSYYTLASVIATGTGSAVIGEVKIEGNYDTQLPALTNEGTMAWSAGNIGADNRMYFANAASGTFIVDAADATSRTMSGGYYGGWFQNDGTVQKTGTGNIAINAYYRDSGTTQVDAGVLSFGGGGSSSGAFVLAANATARLVGGTLTLQDGFSATGAGTFEVPGGILAPTGTTAISNLTVNGGQVYNEANAGTLTVGDLALSAGAIGSNNTLTETVATGSDSTVTGDVRIEGNYTTQLPALTNAGTLTWSAGNISAFNRMYMTNATTGTFVADAAESTSRTMSGGYYGGWFQNDGTVQKTGTGNIAINAYYRGTGDTRVDAGMLSFGGGGSTSGNFDIEAGATARLVGGTLSLQDGFSATGAGTFEGQGGVLAPTGTTTINHLAVTGGQVYNEANAGTLTVGNLALSAGAIGSNNTLTETVATGSDSTVTGDVRIEGNYTTQLPALTNAGTLTWSAGNISAFNRMYLTNADTGTFIADAAEATNRTMSGGYYGGWFQNDGSVQKIGTGTIAISAYYRGSGTTHVDAGVFQVGAGGNLGGSVTIAADATFRHSGAGLILQDGFTASGAGRFENTGGDLQIGADVSIAQLHVSGGQVGYNETSPATLHVGDLHLSGGTIGSNDNQATVIASGANSTIKGNVTLNGTGLNAAHTLVNTGTLTWTAGNVNGGNYLKLHNAAEGTFVADIADGSAVTLSSGYYGGWFINDGTLRKTGDGTANLNSAFENNGTLSVEGGRLVINGSTTSGSGASLVLAAGASFRAANALTLASLSGSGTIENSVTVTSSLAPGSSPGLLNITGNLTLGSGSTSVFEIAGLTAGTGYDQVVSTGSVALDGMLSLSITSAFAATLSSSATFDLLSAASLTGTFANATDGMRLADIDGIGSFLVSYTGTTFRLGNWEANASAVPEPATTVVLLGFVALGSALVRRRPRETKRIRVG